MCSLDEHIQINEPDPAEKRGDATQCVMHITLVQ